MSSEGVPRQAEREAAREQAVRTKRAENGREGWPFRAADVRFGFDAGWEARDPEVRGLEVTARLKGFIEGWQCARLKPDGSLPSVYETREAAVLAGFSDVLIDAVFAEPVAVEGEANEHVVRQCGCASGYGFRATCSCGWTETALSLDGVETAGDAHRAHVGVEGEAGR